MDNKVKDLSELSIEEFHASYDKAVSLYHTHPNSLEEDKIKDISDFNILGQTALRPMHPRLFYDLSQIRGFNNMNGHCYEDYYNNYVKNFGIGD